MDRTDKVRDYLTENNIDYISYYHEPYIEVKDLAEFLQFPPSNFVRTYLMKSNGDYFLLLLPDSKKFNIASVKQALSKKSITLANDKEFRKLFKDCEPGTVPPFENYCNLPIYMDENLKGKNEIVFNTCSKWESIKIKLADYIKLVKPRSIFLV